MSRGRLASLAALLLLAVAAVWWLWPDDASDRQRAPVIAYVPGQAGRPGLSLPETSPPPARNRVQGDPLPSVDDPPREPKDPTVTFSGWLLDARGEPLVNHVLRLSLVGENRLSPVLDETRTSGRGGWFEFEAVQPGSKLLEVRGPGEGDLPVYGREDPVSPKVPFTFTADEGILYLTIPPESLREANVLGAWHAKFWVECLLDRELPSAREHYDWWDAEIALHDPALPLPPRAAVRYQPDGFLPNDVAADLRGLVLRLNVPDYSRWVRDLVMVGANESVDTLLVVRHRGFADAMKPVSGAMFFESAGTIRLERRAHLSIVIRDAASGDVIEEGSIEVRESGGDVPDRVTRIEVEYGFGESHDCDRRSGRYELFVTSPGYRSWTGGGDLLISEESQHLVVELQPDD